MMLNMVKKEINIMITLLLEEKMKIFKQTLLNSTELTELIK